MPNQQDTKTKDIPSSESGYKSDKKTDPNPQSGHGGTGMATGRSAESGIPGPGTGTASQTPDTAQQNPGTSGKSTDVTGDATERSVEGRSESGESIRNPSGDALGDAVDGDEGSGKRI